MSLNAGSVYAELGAKLDPAGFDKFGAEMNASAARMEAGEKRINASQKRVGESTKAMGKEAQKSADLYQDAAGRWRNATGQFASDAERAAAGVETANRRVKTSTTQTSSAIEQMAKKSGQSYERIGHAAKIGATGGILAFAAVVGKSVMAAGDLEQVLNVFQETAHASDGQMKKVSATAMKLGADMTLPGTSAKDAADAMLELSKANLSVNESMTAARGVLQLSAAAQISNGEAAIFVGDTLNAFNLKAKDSVRVADLLAAAANAASGTIPEMGSALQQSAASAHQLKIPVEDLVTMIGEMANAGIKGSDAGTSLKTMMAALTPSTAKAKDAVKALGVDTFDANGKFVGIKDTIKQYKEGLSKLTDEQKAQTLETIFGSDASRAAAIIMDQGVGAFERMKKKTTEVGAAGDLAKAQMKGFNGAVENIKSGAETAAITLGQSLLPLFTDGAKKVGEFFSSLDPGDIKNVGGQIAGGLKEFVDVAGDVVHVGGQVAGVLLDVGRALNLGDAGNIEAILAAFAGFKIAGVVAPMVASLATNLAGVVTNARTAPTALAFLRALPIGPLQAVGIAAAVLAGGLVLLGNQESIESGIARESASAHKAQAEAMKAVHDSEMAAADKGLAAKQSTIDYKTAVENFNKVRDKSKKGSAEYEQAENQVAQASLRSKSAHEAYTKSLREQNDQNKKNIAGAKEAFDKAREQADGLKKQVTDQSKFPAGQRRALADNPEVLRVQAAATRALASANEDYIQAVARANVSDTNRNRLMDQSKAITKENTLGVSDLIDHLDGVPASKQTKLLLDDQGALADAGTLARSLDAIGKGKTVAKILTTAPSAAAAVAGLQAVLHGVPASTVTKINQNAPSAGAAVEAFRAIVAGVPASKVIKILQNAGSAAGAVNSLKGAIDNLHDKQVTITTIYNTIRREDRVTGKGHFATGRGAGQGMQAVVGEGRDPVEWIVNPGKGEARRVDQPQVTSLDDGDYVLPRDPRYRGRSVGWLAEIANDLGIQAFAGGKAPKTKPKAKARYIPPKLEPTAYDVEDFDNRESDARGAINKSKSIRKLLANAETQLRRAERMPTKTAKQKAARKDSVDQAKRRIKGYDDDLAGLPERGNLTRLRALWAERKKELKDAKTFQAKIDLETKRANNARDAMALADKRDDGPGYEKARKDQASALKNLEGWLQGARALTVKAGNVDRAADLEGTLTQIASDLIDNAAAEQEETPAQQAAREAGEREADTGMTDAERARLDDINRDVALAALTLPLDDDKAAAESKVGFFQQILDAALVDPARGGAAAIADIADSLKTAKDNLASFTGTGTNNDPDLQAQLDQANERTRTAGVESAVNAAALQAFQGFSAAGAGGLGGGTTVNINTLHPGDPKVWSAVAAAANQGNDLSLSGGGGTVKVGP